MESLSLETIMQLAQPADGHRVSIYMPTSRFSPNNQEKDSTRLKNLLRDAEAALVGAGMRTADAQALLAPGRALLDDRPFWLRSRDGLAVLLGESSHHVLQIAMPVPEHVHVDHRFWIRPLLPLLGRDESYWVLALSQKRVRLLEGGPSSLVEVPAERIPESLSDALQWEDFEKASLQFHTGTSGSHGKRPAVFHGTGEPDTKNELVRFFREIHRGLHEHLGKDHAPLVLAGVDYLIPLYREVSTCPSLLADAVTGNPDSLGEQVLHERSWEIAAREFSKPVEEAVTAIVEAWASQRVVTDPQQILEASANGRVGSLLVSESAGWWSPKEGAAEITVRDGYPEGDEDLLERAALDTLANGGDVLTVPADKMPHGARVVTMLRY
ncbi:baeRF3 domain-containing protein [Anaerosoma tenue]|uniref:baeRF3 domain-containing protein n=1 Tax=Anaerosoma tenue TaxID=2933588 RepID=UPI0022609A62|nr:hypothetical protein [Anaerosoma tenue]MCK8115193.1 hypothetical protein [Anaerosoma tenue]